MLEPGPITDKGPTEINGPGGDSPDYLMTSGQLFETAKVRRI